MQPRLKWEKNYAAMGLRERGLTTPDGGATDFRAKAGVFELRISWDRNGWRGYINTFRKEAVALGPDKPASAVMDLLEWKLQTIAMEALQALGASAGSPTQPKTPIR